MIAQLSNAVCYLVVVVALARALGKEGLGRYYTIFALTVAVQLVVEGGLGTVLTYRIAAPDNWRRLVAEAAGLFAAVTVISAALLLVVGAVWPAQPVRPATSWR